MQGFKNATPPMGKGPRMADVAETIDWPTDEHLEGRMVGPVYSYANHWVTIATEQRPAPKGVSIPKMCLDHDGETDKRVTDVCPYCKAGMGRDGKEYWINFIVRDLQQDDRGKVRKFPTEHSFEAQKLLDYKAFWGKKGDAKRTPVRLLRIPDSQVTKLTNLGKLNKVRTDDGVETYELSDIKYGCDIAILESNDPKIKGAAKFDIQKRERTPLTADERRYLIFRPDLIKPEPLDRAKREMENLSEKMITESKKKPSRRADDDEEAPRNRRGSRDEDDRPSSRRGSSDDEMEEDLAELDESDLDDDDTPKKRRASRDDEDDAPPKKRRARDDDEDDAPPKKRRARDDDEDDAPPKRRASRDDEDDEDDRPARRKSRDDEDDEDAPRARSRKSEDDDDRPAKRKSRADEDDEPRARRKSQEDDDRPARRKSRADEDDEDDRPARRKSRDDEDDDIPF